MGLQTEPEEELYTTATLTITTKLCGEKENIIYFILNTNLSKKRNWTVTMSKKTNKKMLSSSEFIGGIKVK